MLIDEALYSIVSADAGVVAIAGTRVSAVVMSQSEVYPAVTFRRINSSPLLRLARRGVSDLARHRYRFFCVATKATGGQRTAARLRDAVKLALVGQSGDFYSTDSPPETLHIGGIFPESTFDLYDDATQTYEAVADYDVWAEEQQPTP